MNGKFPLFDLILYPDAGLGSYVDVLGPTRETLSEDVIVLFKKNGLDITINMILNIIIITVNFLNLSFDVSQKDIHCPFRKDISELDYIENASNHTLSIMKQLPIMIEKRLSELSNSH